MKSWKAAIGYGILLWLAVFAVAIAAFPLRSSERPLFESIMPVALVLITALLSYKYFKKYPDKWLEGLKLGLFWLVINLLIDAVMFSRGPMQISLSEYLKDIGLTYLIIPIITTAIAKATQIKNKEK